MLELGAPQSWYDEGEHLLQMVAEQGAEDAQRISSIVYRDLYPEQAPDALIRSRSPLERTALTVGRFSPRGGSGQRSGIAGGAALLSRGHACRSLRRSRAG